jgi:hypothetical protein
VVRLLVTANVFSSCLILVSLTIEAIRFSETRFLQVQHAVVSQKTVFFAKLLFLSVPEFSGTRAVELVQSSGSCAFQIKCLDSTCVSAFLSVVLLCNDASSISGSIGACGRLIVRNELEGMWKEAAIS